MDYGVQLERLKQEFEQRVESERDLHSQIQQQYEKYISQLQADATRNIEVAVCPFPHMHVSAVRLAHTGPAPHAYAGA